MLFLYFTLLLFLLSIFGIMTVRNNLIIILILLELMLISINMNFALISFYIDDLFGQLFFICVLGIAGAEAAIGLAILILYYRLRGIISSETLHYLKG